MRIGLAFLNRLSGQDTPFRGIIPLRRSNLNVFFSRNVFLDITLNFSEPNELELLELFHFSELNFRA